MRSIGIWQQRYRDSGNSGLGSRGDLLQFKVDFINSFIEENNIETVLDFGHGDLEVANGLVVSDYTGIDIFESNVSHESHIKLVNSRFDEYDGDSVDLVLCLDVLYHILEDEEEYLCKTIDKLIEKANKFVVIYAQDSLNLYFDHQYKEHLHNSKWIQYIQKAHSDNLTLIHRQDEPTSGSSALFFVYKKNKV